MNNTEITLLSDHIINQIAAGEVIENPASVIKELIENSLDAKSEKIEIEIKAGGMLFIRVTDDGFGMSRENLKKSILRHATSKIKEFEDLQHVSTMGFRGEALASIASISKLRIESFNNDLGYVISSEGGEISEIEPCARVIGTQIEIKSLFYNVPVRKKFQKTTSILISEIVKTVNNLALANPNIGFTLISEGKKVIDVKSQKSSSFKEALKERIQYILGENILKNLQLLDFKEESFHLQGFIGSPLFVKKNRTSQFLFLNKRSVYSKEISQAVKTGYATRISDNDYPIFILHLDTDSKFIDVNVHPQKKVVRISEEQFIKQKIVRAISDSFKENIKNISFDRPLSFYKKEVMDSYEQDSFEEFVQESLFSRGVEKKENIDIKPISIMGEYFLIEKADQSLLAIDLKAASASIFFDKINKSIQGNIESQSLAFAFVLDFIKQDMIIIENNLEVFSRMGFVVRVIGDKTIAIDAIPSFSNKESFSDYFNAILEEILLFGKSDVDIKLIDKKIAVKISKVVKLRKKNYTLEEAKQITKDLMQIDNSGYDPLGALNMINIEKEDLAKLFSNKKGTICHF
jgi:DNA mismatch repair protein MutL